MLWTKRLRLLARPGLVCGLLAAFLLGGCGVAPSLTPNPPTQVSGPCPGGTDPSAAIDSYLTAAATSHSLSGAVLVACDGEVILSKGYGMADRAQSIPNTADTKFRIGGMTAPFTATVILALQQIGLLDVQDPICKYVGDCPDAWQDITIHHLLTHTSGIPDYAAGIIGKPEVQSQPSSRAELIARFADLPINMNPGTVFAWSSSNYVLLGEVIEKAEGEGWPYATILQAAVLGPLGMTQTGYDSGRKDLAVGYDTTGSTTPAAEIHMSNLDAAGALYSTIGDLYKFDQALSTAGWGIADHGPMAQETVDQMFEPRIMVATGPAEVGYGWIINEIGGHRAYLTADEGGPSWAGWFARYPDDKVTIIILSNQAALISPIPDMYFRIHDLIFGAP